MSFYNKIIGSRSVSYTLSKIISALLSLVSISLFTRIFDTDTYGNYFLFISYNTFICSLFFWWHRLSMYRYYHKYKKRYESFVKTSYLYFIFITLIIIVLGLLVYILLSKKISLIMSLLPFCILASVFRSNFDLNQSLFNISREDFHFCINIIVRPLVFVSLSLLFHYVFGLESNVLIYAMIFSYALIVLISNFIIFKDLRGGGYKKEIISKFYSYGFPLTGLFIFDYILTFSDRLLIGHYLGPDMVGMYGANYDFIKMMVLFLMTIQGYIIYPELNKTFENNDMKEVNKLMSFNFNIFVSIFFLYAFLSFIVMILLAQFL